MTIEAKKERDREEKNVLGEPFQRGPWTVLQKDPATKARVGRLQTAHGIVETPCFMPCGTQGTVKAISSEELEALGTQMILSNAYHLYLRPGEGVFEKIGTLHDFMGWRGPILTDSGGFQIFSLAPLKKVTDEGLFFQSHVDGSKEFLTPERIIQFQTLLGSDVIMVLDECIGYPIEAERAEEAMRRTLRWAERSKEEFQRGPSSPLLFGIVQGGTFPALREECCERLVEIGFQGYGIGGLAVGEPEEEMWCILSLCTDRLPQEEVKYLMGVGTPQDILEGIALGIDLFDCVLPTRNGRNGQAFTSYGTLNLRNASFAADTVPLEEGCGCITCRRYSRAYLHHLLKAKEILAARLLTYHNLFLYLRLMKEAREAIRNGAFRLFQSQTLQRLGVNP